MSRPGWLRPDGGSRNLPMCSHSDDPMNIKLISVENKGDLEKEAVWLDVVDDADVGNYALCDTTYVDEDSKRASNGVQVASEQKTTLSRPVCWTAERRRWFCGSSNR